MENVKLSNGVPFTVLRSEKFKINTFSLNFFLPLNNENISCCHVLSKVMGRGTKKYPNILLLGRKLDTLYHPRVGIFASKMLSSLAFRVTVSFLDDRFLPEGDDTDILGESLEIAKEMLTDPLTEGDGLPVSYVESEKKNQISAIKSKINNKDAYAMQRGVKAALGDIPFACDSLGTIDEVEKITPKKLYDLLGYILEKAPAEATFAGNFTEKYSKIIETFISEVIGGRNEDALIPIADKIMPSFDTGIKTVSEDIDAKQGRMVLAYDLGDITGKEAAVYVFNDIFGASPVSGLFMNVREKMHLCYYCSSSVNAGLSVMYVRSGIAPENKQLALDAIAKELKLLCDPENIKDSLIETSKKSILSQYTALEDSAATYLEWYLISKYHFAEYDIKKRRENIKKVTKEEVAAVASNARLKVVYFLNGTAKDTDTEEDEDEN